MATKLVIRDGAVTGVYDDRWRPLLEALSGGPLEVRRATNVEFDDATGEWVATLLATGQVIARGYSRDEVIKQEVAYLEREIIR